MLILTEKEIEQNYSMKDAIKDLKQGLITKKKERIVNPLRTVINFPEYEASSLYMPSADLSQNIASVKVVTIFPQNPVQGKPTTQGLLLLTDATEGTHLCMMNASFLTRLRTGALSGIGTSKLARTESRVLGVIGTGGMAFEQVLGILAVRGIEEIILFNRTKERAIVFKSKLIDYGIHQNITIVDDVKKLVTQSDIICCSTRSNNPVFNGDDLMPGTHINGVGSFLPNMREVDITTIKRTEKVVVDDLSSAKEEAGELIYAEKSGEWSFSNIYGELKDLGMDDELDRDSAQEITFFKSVGAAYFDLVVAIGIYKKAIENRFGSRVTI